MPHFGHIHNNCFPLICAWTNDGQIVGFSSACNFQAREGSIIINLFQLIGQYFWLALLGMICVQYIRSAARPVPPDSDPERIRQINFYRAMCFGLQALPWCIVGAGILSGNLKDIWSIFNIRQGNPFTLAFIATFAATTWGGALWVFTGGAKKIIDLQLMDQLGYRGMAYTERGVKVAAAMGMFAPVGFIVGCLAVDGPGGLLFSTASPAPQTQAISADGYRIVFDLAQTGFTNWQFPAFGLVVLGFGAISVIFRKDMQMKVPAKMQRFSPFMFLGFAIIWLIGAFSTTYLPYRHLRDALDSGQAAIVEGKVSDFGLTHLTKHTMEHFCVRGTCFSYSDFVSTGGFNNMASHGGPIHDGLQVRVAYVDTTIVRLEIASSDPTSGQ